MMKAASDRGTPIASPCAMVIILVRDALLALAISTTVVLSAHLVGLAVAFAPMSEPVQADAELCMTCVCADGACTP